jgi:hypothetical protein
MIGSKFDRASSASTMLVGKMGGANGWRRAISASRDAVQAAFKFMNAPGKFLKFR